jgi:DNA-binding GntR family transcriptional regulator
MAIQTNAPDTVAGAEQQGASLHNQPVGRVLALITERLKEGRLVPGQSIIARDLAAELGLSGAPVREALHILAGQGIVELLPQRSPRIRSLTVTDMLDILRIWRGLGAVSVRLAAMAINHRPGNAEIVTAAMQKLKDTSKLATPLEMLGATIEFSEALDKVSGNKYLTILKSQLLITHLHRHLARYWAAPDERDLIVRNMAAITKRVLSGDSVNAEKIFMGHIDVVIAKLESIFPAN